MKGMAITFLLFSLTSGKLPKGGYLLSSGVLPGSGQLLLQERVRGELFLLADGLFWLSFFTAKNLGNFLNRDAILFAVGHASANGNKKGDEYYKSLEEYNSSFEFNEICRREARSRYPNDPEKQKEYLETHGYFGEDSWQWESDSARISYWRMRRQARSYHLRAKFFLAGNLLLRALSVFDCSYLLDKRKRLSYQFRFWPEAKFGLTYKF